MTATHATVRHLTGRVESLGHKLFMDNLLSSPRILMIYWDEKYIHAGQYGPAEKTCPLTSDQKITEIDKGRYKGEDQGKFDYVSLEGQTFDKFMDRTRDP